MKVLAFFAGTAAVCFSLGTVIPWWVAKPAIVGGVVLTAIAYTAEQRVTGRNQWTALRMLLGVVTIALATSQLVRLGVMELYLTLAAGIKARRAE